ncbi:MAG: SBBP repeat-containing protein [Vicingaceae bacterium]
MKVATTLITILSCILLTSKAQAQDPGFYWARIMGGTDAEIGTSIKTDSKGNIYTTGYYRGSVDFDPGPSTKILNSNGDDDIFIQKLDIYGNLIWVKQVGGLTRDQGRSLTIDSKDNVIITGSFTGIVDFDPAIATVNTFTSKGEEDIFILKLDPSGNLLWAKQMGGPSYNIGQSITTDELDFIYTTGYFDGTVDFDPGAGLANLSNIGGEDNFIQKLDSNGNFKWIKHIGGPGSARGNEIIYDSNGHIYSTGFFFTKIDFNPNAGIQYLTNNGFPDAFILKLDTAGDFKFVKQIGDGSYLYGNSIATDFEGNIYTTGIFLETTDFDPGPGALNYTPKGGFDIFVQKLDSNGIFKWAKQIGGSDFEYGNTVSTDINGNVYVAGSFRGTVDFDPGQLVNNLTSKGFGDIYILRLDIDGDFDWVSQMGASINDAANSIFVDANGFVHTTGSFGATVDFDPTTSSWVISSAGSIDIFVQKLSQCLTTFSVDTQVTCGSFTWIDNNTYDTSNQSATFTLMNTGGCDSIVTLNLTINEVTDLSTSVNDFIITANNVNASSFQWLDCDSSWSIIPDDTNRTFSPTKNGNYAVQITENACVDTSACVEITALSVIKNSFKENIEVFPNPTNGNFAIKFENPQNTLFVRLSTVKGKLITSETFKNVAFIPMELNNAKGIYFLEIQDQFGKKAIIKLIKK